MKNLSFLFSNIIIDISIYLNSLEGFELLESKDQILGISIYHYNYAHNDCLKMPIEQAQTSG